jgi:HEAT repeat protein
LRKTSADVLAQLGYAAEHPFALESQTILERLLQDSSIGTVRAALIAFGHLRVGDLSLMASCARHPDPEIRRAVVHALLPRDELPARRLLIELSADPAETVRDWATFGLGTCSRADSPDLRAALVERLDDADDETRGEAIFGLANRKDPRALPAIARELARDEVSGLALEAAAKMPDQRFLPALEALLRSSPEDKDILEAIAACRGQRAS